MERGSGRVWEALVWLEAALLASGTLLSLSPGVLGGCVTWVVLTVVLGR